MLKNIHILIFTLIIQVLLISTALADPPIFVKLTLIEAEKKQTSYMDQALASSQDKLIKKFSQYQSFKQIGNIDKKLNAQQTISMSLVKNIKANVLYEGEDQNKYKLRLQIPEKKVDLEIKSQNNHTIFQVMQKNQKDTLLILMINISSSID